MTLILKFDLDMVKIYHHTKHQVSMSTHSKVIDPPDTQTHQKHYLYCIRGGNESFAQNRHSLLKVKSVILPNGNN